MAGNFLSGPGGSRGPIEDLSDRLLAGGASLVCASRFRNGLIRGADLVSTAIRKRHQYEAGVVDLYSGRAFLWGESLSIVLKRLQRPFVLALHGGGLPEFAKEQPTRVRACLQRATVVTAPSRYLVDAMRQYRSDIELLPNPLEISSYSFAPRTYPKPNLIWVRAFHQIYNPELAPYVLALLVDKFPEIELTMVGPDKGDGSFARTQQTAARLGVANRISFPGGVPREDVPAWLERADMFINTTDVDNTPVSVLEAMACGLCVVSTEAGGLPKMLTSQENALLVPRNDASAMAEAVDRVLSDPALATKLSHNGRRTAEAFDWSAILPRWRAVLSRLKTNPQAI